MSRIFYGIEDLFVNVLFAPLDMLRFTQSWWAANSINWLFIIIGFVAMAYWMQQLKIFDGQGEEDESSTSHSYL